MKAKLKNYGIIIMSAVVALVIASCSSFYSYKLIAYNETTAKVREHEILGSVKLKIKAEEELYEENYGLRAMIIEEARNQYGDEVDDVVNVAISQTIVNGTQDSESYLLLQGDAIKYKEVR